MDRGLLEPSYEWRRDYALVLGLDRVLNDPQPKLASGTTLRRHQVDALAGQLAALIGDLERRALHEDDDENGNGNGNGEIDDAEVDEDDEEIGDTSRTRTRTTRTRTSTTRRMRRSRRGRG